MPTGAVANITGTSHPRSVKEDHFILDLNFKIYLVLTNINNIACDLP
jgi:hypothetical protein